MIRAATGETPMTVRGRRVLWVYDPEARTGYDAHFYLDLDTDMRLSDRDVEILMRPYVREETIIS